MNKGMRQVQKHKHNGSVQKQIDKWKSIADNCKDKHLKSDLLQKIEILKQRKEVLK